MSFIDKFQNYNIQNHGVRLPIIETGSDNFEYLYSLCDDGCQSKIESGKIPPGEIKKYADRCAYELKVLKKHGLVDYFLLIHDVLSWCDKNGIARGYARGSSAGSLVFYLIGCNHIDPIKHDLPFTRFISEARVQSNMVDGIVYLAGRSLPDFDADASYINRHKILQYIEDRHPGKTSKILTLSTFSGKILIKDCCKIYLDYSEDEAKRVSDMIERLFGKVQDLSDAYKNGEPFKEWVDSSDRTKECYKIALSLENLIRGKGQHPSGIAISFDEIADVVPLELSSSRDRVSSYPMDEIAEMMVKLDILGLKNTDVNAETCALAGLDIHSIDINDLSVYRFFELNTNFHGLFQISEGLTKKTCIAVKPKSIDDLACVLSLSRPGSLKDIPKYLSYKGGGVLESIYPAIDKCLASTANIIVYQEQINQICIEVYGFDPVMADQVRYAVGKKKRDEVKRFEPIIFQKGLERGIPEDVTRQIWQTINDSADYLFSKNHAYAYAYTTALNTYLKANHTKEFFLACLGLTKAEPDPTLEIQKIQDELCHYNMRLLGPDLTNSQLEFSIEGNDIRFGLKYVKGISDKTIEKLIKFKKSFNNKFEIFSSANEAGLNQGTLAALIQAGSMDRFLTATRSKTVLELQLWSLLTDREKELAAAYGEKYSYDLLKLIIDFNTTLKNEKGKPIVKDSRRETIRSHFKEYQAIYRQNSKHERLASYFYENKLLGYSYSQNLTAILKEKQPQLIQILDVKDAALDSFVVVCGQITEAYYGTSRAKGTKYCKLSIKDTSGSCNVLLFTTAKNDRIKESEDLNGCKFEEDQVVIVRGRKKEDCIFADLAAVQDANIYTKLGDFRKKDIDKKAENV